MGNLALNIGSQNTSAWEARAIVAQEGAAPRRSRCPMNDKISTTTSTAS